MAVSAYASLLSLTHVLENLHCRARFHFPGTDMNQIETLQEHVRFLLEFVEICSETQKPEIKAIWRPLAEAAFEAEEIIILHVCKLLRVRSQGEITDVGFLDFCETMEEIIQKMRFFKKEMLVIKEGGENVNDGKQSGGSVPAADSFIVSSRCRDVVVGIDEHLIKIMDKLTRGKSNIQILPIVGMGGIGKTTLAKSVFDHPHIVNHFDVCMWLTISQEYNAKHILKGLLNEEGNEESWESLVELGDRLYKKLFGRRYLIVMDDIWTPDAWNELNRFFPDNESGSRIMLTTRLSDMAASLGSYNPYPLNFLDEDKSWDLFCQNAFSQIGCPYEHLEKFAKDIAKNCRGLPLEIVLIGRLLANSDMTTNYWKDIAKNVGSLVNLGNDDHCLKILSLSYKNLPIHLKPCFLYMRVFPEDALIYIPKLINYWVAEGFIKPEDDKCLEETAREYLKSLIDRNLIFNRNIEEMCGIHDLLRDLCLKESHNECFIQSPKVQRIRPHFEISTCCLFCGEAIMDKEGIHLPKLLHIFVSSLQVTRFVCDACKTVYSHITRPSLVRTVEDLHDDGFCKDILQPIQVRYASIGFTDHRKFVCPSTLYLLWNLQRLEIDLTYDMSGILLPPEIWEMPQLRHIICEFGLHLNDPVSTNTEEGDFLVLNNLQTLSHVLNFKCTNEILNRIPNLKNLDISYKDKFDDGMKELIYSPCNLEQLQKLESLEVKGALEIITFPSSLKHLYMYDCQMTWDDMSIIGSLPNLEKLKLASGVKGLDWNLVEGEFLPLKELDIDYVGLVWWRADHVHFPILERLELEDLESLEEIPLGIGDIPTLQLIRLHNCKTSTINSANKIWEEQSFMGNEIRIDVSGEPLAVFYQIGPFTARMTTGACVSLAFLKLILRLFLSVPQLGQDYLNTKQTETVEENIHFLLDFVKVHFQSRSRELESLTREIVEVFRKVENVNFCLYTLHLQASHGENLLEDVEILLEKMTTIKEELSVAKEEGEDDQVGYESLEIEATDNGAKSYDIKSLGVDTSILDSYWYCVDNGLDPEPSSWKRLLPATL